MIQNIFFLIDTNAKMWSEITGIEHLHVIPRKPLFFGLVICFSLCERSVNNHSNSSSGMNLHLWEKMIEPTFSFPTKDTF